MHFQISFKLIYSDALLETIKFFEIPVLIHGGANPELFHSSQQAEDARACDDAY